MTVEGLTGAIADSADRAIGTELARLQGFAGSHLRTCVGLGNAPVMVLLAVSGEAGSTYSTVLNGQMVMQVVEHYSRQQLGLDARVLQSVSAPSPSVSVPGMLSLFASHTPFLHVARDPAADASSLPLNMMTQGIVQHRASAVIAGVGGEHDTKAGTEPPLALSAPDVTRVLNSDFRSVSLAVIQPAKQPTSSDLFFGAASLLTEHVLCEEPNGWVLDTSKGALPAAEIKGWRGNEDTSRLFHFHWEPPALAAQTATEAELVFGLAGTRERDQEADDLQVLGERFGRADSGRILAAQELAPAWPVPRGGAERWTLTQMLLEEAGLLPQEEAVPAAQPRKAAEQPTPAPARGARSSLSLDIVRQQMATVVDEALELLTTASEIHNDQSLMEVGLNSMHAAQLRDIIYSSAGSAHSGLPALPATMVFDYPTKAAITQYLTEQVATFIGATNAAAEEPKAAVAAPQRAATSAELKARFEEILRYTRTTIADVIGNEVGDDIPLMTAGVNSMHAAQLRDFLQSQAREQMGLSDLQLPATLVFDFPSTQQIAGFIFSHVKEAQTVQAEESKLGEKDELGELGGQEGEPTWCVARAKRLLRNYRKLKFQDVKFAYVQEAPILEKALFAMSDQNKTGVMVQSPSQCAADDDAMSVNIGGDEIIQQLSSGYVKAEGRIFMARNDATMSSSGLNWFTQFTEEVKSQDNYRGRGLRNSHLWELGALREGGRRHRYSVSGTWSKWQQLEDMELTENEMWVRTVSLRPGEVEEFQIVVDGDWNQVHFPPPGPCGKHSADIMGPELAHGRNFFIQVPRNENERVRCTIALSPELRRVHWYFWSSESGAASSSAPPANLTADPVAATASWAAGAEGGWRSRDGQRSRSERFKPKEGYFVIGNWDRWTEFVKLLPSQGSEEPAFRAEVTVAGGSQVEFQLVADRDTGKHFTPRRKVNIKVPVTGGKTNGILGPSDLPELHWVVTAPPRSRLLHLSFNPTGEKSLRWEFK